MLERRANPVGRAATAGVPRISLGGLRLAVLDIEQTANFMIDMVFPQRRVGRPLYLTSANGEVLARCSTEPMTDRLFRAADLINADGQPLVTVSRFKSSTPLPERVATTDLFHTVARKAAAAGLTFYMFGADEAENAAAVANVRKMYPDLRIVGHSHGYLKGDALRAKVDEINALAPDYLWVALGVPYEQAFVEEFTSRLSNVGVIKTSGGLFNFLSGSRARAPQWMQTVGLEWAWRIWLEPRRLFWRYLTTNPRALYLLFNKSRPSNRAGRHEADDMNDRPAILVTGGAGYIGSHCCRALAAAGYQPVVFDNFSTGHRSFVTGSLVTGDLADKARAGARLRAARHRRGDAFRGIEPGRRVRRRSAEILHQQPRRHAVAAGGDARGRTAIAWCFPRPARSMATPTARRCPKATLARRSIPTAPRNG